MFQSPVCPLPHSRPTLKVGTNYNNNNNNNNNNLVYYKLIGKTQCNTALCPHAVDKTESRILRPLSNRDKNYKLSFHYSEVWSGS